MTDLIKITERDDQQVVSARELYFGLGYNQTDYSKWVKRSITENEYFIENEDWVELGIDAELLKINKLPPRPSKDYALSINMAKKLAMMAKTEIGNKYRDYFIACEKKLKEQSKNQLPQTFAQALALAAEQALKLEEQQKAIEVMKPKEEFFDAVAGSKDAISMNEVAKVLDIKGMGRNKMFEFLRENKVLMNNNIPMQRYVDCGYFRVVEQKYMKDNEQCINVKTLVYQKGVDFIRKLVLKNTK